jgi:hypothetical protein
MPSVEAAVRASGSSRAARVAPDSVLGAQQGDLLDSFMHRERSNVRAVPRKPPDADAVVRWYRRGATPLTRASTCTAMPVRAPARCEQETTMGNRKGTGKRTTSGNGKAGNGKAAPKAAVAPMKTYREGERFPAGRTPVARLRSEP